MTWGHEIEYLEKIREDMGIMPKGLANMPERHELGEFLFTAFNTLSSSRHYNDGSPLPISITEMWAYCGLASLDDADERLSFVRAIQKMDNAYLTVVAKRNAKTTESKVVNNEQAPDNPLKG